MLKVSTFSCPLLLSFLLALLHFTSFSQLQELPLGVSSSKQAVFHAHPNQRFGFDANTLEYRVGLDSFQYRVPYKVVSSVFGDTVLIELIGLDSFAPITVISSSLHAEVLQVVRLSDSTLQVYIPASKHGYEVLVLQNDQLLGSLNVVVYDEKKIQVALIPVGNAAFPVVDLQAEINARFRAANISCSVSVLPSLKENLVSLPLELPEELDFTSFSQDMTRLAKQVNFLPPQTYRIFLVSGFSDTNITGYAAFGNTSLFVGATDSLFFETLLTQFARSIAYIPEFEYQDSTLIFSHNDWQYLHEGANCLLTWKEAQVQKGTAGLVSYHFWEEDEHGFIKRSTFSNPYKRNYTISLTKRSFQSNISIEQVQKSVMLMSHTKGSDFSKSTFEVKNDKQESASVEFPLSKKQSTSLSAMIYTKTKGVWQSNVRKQVLYFNVTQDSLLRFSHANDSVVLDKYNVAHYANGHFLVYTHWKSTGKIAKQEVYSYQGELVTDFFIKPQKVLPKRVLVFSNGYRGPDKNGDVSDHLVSTRDRYHYWMGIDTAFKRRLQAKETLYIDGNHGIGTSSHQNMLNFGLSIAMVKTIARHDDYSILNKEPNVEGFEERRKQGQIAGKAYLVSRCSYPGCLETKDTIDIVAHSMGYAYALGFMDALDGKVVFGKIYILAPENACVGGFDWSRVEEVWQYGSNLDQANPDPVWEQDGIAPQCQVKGLENVDKMRGGRAFIPKDWPHKNFVDSHMLHYYFWIFDRIKKGDSGYISR